MKNNELQEITEEKPAQRRKSRKHKARAIYPNLQTLVLVTDESQGGGLKTKPMSFRKNGVH